VVSAYRFLIDNKRGIFVMADSNTLAIIHRHTPDAARIQYLGPYGIESLIEPEEEASGTAYRVHIAPGQRTAVSYHRVAEEYYFVLSGQGMAILDGVEHTLASGDFLRLPPGTKHGFVTLDEPLEMLNIHTPGSRPDRDVYFVDSEAPEGFSKLE
jgi:mannose-6-phosphate isomerase-like protein (cupin superfamily)